MKTATLKYLSIYLLACLFAGSSTPLELLTSNGTDWEVTWMEAEEKGGDAENEEKELEEVEKLLSQAYSCDGITAFVASLFHSKEPMLQDILLDVPIPPPELV